MRLFLISALALAAAPTAACTGGEVELIVDVRTDLVPGSDVTSVQVERFDASPDPLDGASGDDRQLTMVDEGQDLVAGMRAATFAGLTPGTHAVRVRLLSGTTVELERIVVVDLEESRGITVVMSRSCLEVTCPAEEPSETQCQAGRCVSPQCSTVATTLCPAPECTADADCGAPSGCAGSVCAEGTCLATECGVMGGGGYADVVVADGPAAYWRLGEAVGPNANDASGSGYEGSIGSQVTLGAEGAICGDDDTAATFDGGTVDAGDVLDFAGNAPFTLEAWVRPADFGSYAILGKNDVTTTDDIVGYKIMLHAIEPDVTRLIRFSRDAPMSEGSANGTAPEEGVYSHVVATYDGAVRLVYVNAERVASRESTGMIPDNEGPFTIGNAEGWLPFRGEIDEVAVYDYVLSPDQIAAHHQAGLCP